MLKREGKTLDPVVSGLRGVTLVELPQGLVRSADEIVRWFPCRFFGRVALPEHQVLYALAPLVRSAPTYRLNHVIRLAFDFFDWRRWLVPILILRLPVWLQLGDMKDWVIPGIRR